MEFIRDYTGRQLDIEALQTAKEPKFQIRLSKTLTSDNAHRKISGLQKLVQRYAILFLNGVGTTKFVGDHGTDFVGAAQRGEIASRELVEGYFLFANLSVRDNLLLEQENDSFGDLPDDERFDRADLIDYFIDTASGYLYLKVSILSESGDEAQFIIPVQ